MPVCEHSKDLLDRRHLGDPIELTKIYEPQLLPAGQFQLTSEPAPSRSTAWNWLRFFNMPSAEAEDFRILYLRDLTDTIGSVRAGEPRAASTTEEFGILSGYAIPPESEVSRDSLPMMLRALAIELGARG
jgi:hypothetical protein